MLILLLAALGAGGAFAYIKFIKPKQGAKVSVDPDDHAFEDEEYENENQFVKDLLHRNSKKHQRLRRWCFPAA